jgi:hypothetical protein
MGVCFSDISRNSISSLRKKQPVVFRMARDLGYSPGDIKNMFKFFNFCDVDDSGTVSIEGNFIPSYNIVQSLLFSLTSFLFYFIFQK